MTRRRKGPALLLAAGVGLAAAALCPAGPPTGATTLDADPPRSPWSAAPGLDDHLGRFTLSSDGRCIYRLGGRNNDRSSGHRYMRTLSRLDLATGRWRQLADVPFGVGGGVHALCPTDGKLVAVAGIAVDGQRFDLDRITFGVYDPAADAWSTFVVGSKGVGRAAAIAWRREHQFVLLTADAAPGKARKVVLADAASRAVEVKANLPMQGAFAGAAVVGDVLFVLECEEKPSLVRLDLATGKWSRRAVAGVVRPAPATQLFAFRGRLVMWMNGPSYLHPSGMFELDAAAGRLRELHPSFPGPQSRTDPAGVAAGPRFCLFGGQRKGHGFLNEGRCCHLLLSDAHYQQPAPKQEKLPSLAQMQYGDEHWRRLTAAWGACAARRDEQAFALLGRDWDASLEVAVSLIYGPPVRAEMTDRGDKVAVLVAQLRSPRWRLRDEAARQLAAMGPSVHRRLAKLLGDADPEVRLRVREILSASTAETTPKQRHQYALRVAATELMDVLVPLEPIRRTARRNFLRLIWNDDVPFQWDAKPRGPLLASLRCSDEPRDRDLVALAAAEARPQLGKMLSSILSDGIRRRTRHEMAAHWRLKPPAHDYADAMFRLLAPAEPEICLLALHHLGLNPRTVERLRAIRPAVTYAPLGAEIDALLARADRAQDNGPASRPAASAPAAHQR